MREHAQDGNESIPFKSLSLRAVVLMHMRFGDPSSPRDHISWLLTTSKEPPLFKSQSVLFYCHSCSGGKTQSKVRMLLAFMALPVGP